MLGIPHRAHSQSAEGAAVQSVWTKASVGESFSDDDLTTSEKTNFGFNFQNSGMRGCDRFPYLFNTIPVSYAIPAIAGANSLITNLAGSGTRKFLRDPQYGRLFLDDEINVNPTLGPSREIATPIKGLPLSFFGTVNLNGTSGVARPLPNQDSCKEIKQYLKLWDFKLVLPLSGKRFAAMLPGEIWRIPVTFTIRIGPSAGYSATNSVAAGLLSGAAQQALMQGVNVVIAISGSTQKSATVTLRRLDENSLRVRVRLGRARILDANGTVFAGAPVVGMTESLVGGLVAHLSKTIAPGVASYISQELLLLLSGQLTLDWSYTAGDTAVLEYVLNPNNADQMDILARLLRGDLNVFKQLVHFSRLSKPSSSDNTDLKQLSALEKEHSQALGQKPSYSGLTAIRSAMAQITGGLPFIGNFSWNRGHDESSFLDMHQEGYDRYHVYDASRQKNWGLFYIPFAGTVSLRNHSQSVQAFASKNSSGSSVGASVLFVDQHGALRRVGKRTAGGLEEYNSVMRYVGVHGAGIDRKMEIPVPSVLASGGIKRSNMNFSLYLSSTAVGSILKTSADEVMAAYRNAFPALETSRAGIAGRLARAVDGLINRRGDKKAARLAGDLLRAGEASDQDDQLAAFAKVVSGKGKSKMGFKDVFRVLVQFVDPTEVAGELLMTVAAQMGQANSGETHLVYNQGLLHSPSVESFAKTKYRYIPPQPLTD